MAQTKEMYFKQGVIGARTNDLSDRPKPGWQQMAYDSGVASVRERVRVAVKQPKSILALSPQRVGLALTVKNWPGLPEPVRSHLSCLNDHYQRETVEKRAERLLTSMGRLLHRWSPRP